MTDASDNQANSAPAVEELARSLEALLFAHGKPVSARRLADILGIASVAPVKDALAKLSARYDATSAMQLQELAGGYQFTTRPEFHELLSGLVRQREAQKLSPATLEALAIVAYKQPIGRQEIENIRGAGSDHLVRALLDRGLIKVSERDKSKPGNPALYGTTGEFLRAFGLRAIGELPQEGDLAAPRDEGEETEGAEIDVAEARLPGGADEPDDEEE